MILADKIIILRKKSGMSQEELADKIGVSRQAVSKWESTQSIPDLDKILLMSKLFSVSTDFLLKDEMEMNDNIEVVEESTDTVQKVTMEMANDYIEKKFTTSKYIALGVLLCILSPACLILLGGLSEIKGWNEDLYCLIGLIILFIMVAISVCLFIVSGNKVNDYHFLETELFETTYGVTGMVKDKKKKYQDTYFKSNLIGIILCVLSVIPLFIGAFSNNDLYVLIGLTVLLFMTSIGVFFMVNTGCKMGAYVRLLQEGDYSKDMKVKSPILETISSCFWTIITGVYLLISFTQDNWDKSWIIWPVAGVFYGAIYAVADAIVKNKRNK